MVITQAMQTNKKRAALGAVTEHTERPLLRPVEAQALTMNDGWAMTKERGVKKLIFS